MQYLTVVLTGLALSMDAFAVSVSDGLCMKLNKKRMLFIAAAFGIMQGAMPVTGYFLASLFSNLIGSYVHWVAFGILLILGIKMLIDGILSITKKEACQTGTKFNIGEILLQSVATSIDALAAGISLLVLKVNIFYSGLIIMALTFIICLFGVIAGQKFSKLAGNNRGIAIIAGGLILIALAVKALF